MESESPGVSGVTGSVAQGVRWGANSDEWQVCVSGAWRHLSVTPRLSETGHRPKMTSPGCGSEMQC